MAFLNALSATEALRRFVNCGGSSRWADRMVRSRPFASAGELFASADRAWEDLDDSDWLEAFRSHPRIGEGPPAAASVPERSSTWAAKEQSGVQQAAASIRTALDEGNRLYEARFGHIFIVCATGKMADEMLLDLRARLMNNPAIELHVAAREQRLIAALRLERLLAEPRSKD